MKITLRSPWLAVMAILAMSLLPLSAMAQSGHDVIAACGLTDRIPNPNSFPAGTFEEIPLGSQATTSVTIQGCMRAGTCDTAADTNTSTTTAMRSVSFSKIYDYYLVTGSCTGGTAPSFVINYRLGYLPASSAGSSVAVTSPLDGSGWVNVDCKTGCAGNPNGQATMANSAPVTIASNQSALPTSDTQAGTWNVRNQDTAGNGITTNSNTYTAKFAFDVNMLGTLGTAFTTPGKVDVTGTVNAQTLGFGSVLSGQQAVTGSVVTLPTNATHWACVKAFVANTISIYVGPSGITTSTGYELGPGDERCFTVTNTNLLFVIAPTTGASISWTAQ